MWISYTEVPKVIGLAELQPNTFSGGSVGMREREREREGGGGWHEAHFPEETAFMAFIAFTPFSNKEHPLSRFGGVWPLTSIRIRFLG